MFRRLRLVVLAAAIVAMVPSIGSAQHKRTPPGLAKKGGVPPGQAKRGCLPPGLAKRLGPKAPCTIYAAVDPEHQDRIWFLIENKWVLKANLQIDAQQELKLALELDVQAPPPPPVPLPKVEAHLTLLFFSD